MPGSVSCFGCGAPLVEVEAAPAGPATRAPRIELEAPAIEAPAQSAPAAAAPRTPPPDVRAFLPPRAPGTPTPGLAASLTRRRARASSSRHVRTILDASDVVAGLVGLVPGLHAARAGNLRLALAFGGAALGALALAGAGLWVGSALLELGLTFAALVVVASMTHATATHALASTRLRDVDDQARAWWAAAMFAIAIALGVLASGRLVLTTQVDVVALPGPLAAELGDEVVWTRRGQTPAVGARRITPEGLVEVLAGPGEAWSAEGGVVTTPRGAIAVRTHPLVAEVGTLPAAALDTAVRAPTLRGHGTVGPDRWLVLERALLSDGTLLLRVRELPARALGAPFLVTSPPARRRLLHGTYP
jgi:hypothetical protein